MAIILLFQQYIGVGGQIHRYRMALVLRKVLRFTAVPAVFKGIESGVLLGEYRFGHKMVGLPNLNRVGKTVLPRILDRAVHRGGPCVGQGHFSGDRGAGDVSDVGSFD